MPVSQSVQYIVNLLIAAGAVQGVFLACVLPAKKTGNRRANMLLAVLLLVFSANIFHAGFLRDLIGADGHATALLFEPFQMLFGPLIYLYIRALTSPNEIRPYLKAFWHFLPMNATTAALMLLGHQWPGSNAAQLPVWVNPLIWGSTLAYLLVYLLFAARRIHRHQARIRDQYSDVSRVDLEWLHFFIWSFIAIEAMYIILFVWMVHGNPGPHFFKLLSLTMAIVVYGLGYRGLLQKDTGAETSEAPLAIATAAGGTSGDSDKPTSLGTVQSNPRTSLRSAVQARYERSGMTNVELAAMQARLLDFMNEKKPWLEPELTLTDLAEQAALTRHQLSQVINEGLKKNFYDFVNEYRIGEFQRLATLPESRQYKILSLALDAGFNSKPTFNMAFKKITGLTPSAWLVRQAGLAGQKTVKQV